MYAVERKSLILSLLEADGKVDVSALAERFDTSCETVRRDLRELEKDGMLQRTHGGAVSSAKGREPHDFPIPVRLVHHYEEKVAICRAAAGMVDDGDTIFVDNSSTTVNLIKYIDRSKSVTLVTNSVQILVEAAGGASGNIQIICLGGQFDARNFSVHGLFALDNARSFYPSKVFMSCRSIDARDIVMDGSLNEVEIKQEMINHSKDIFLLADHTKFGKSGTVFLTDLCKISHIVTDAAVGEDVIERIRNANIALTIA